MRQPPSPTEPRIIVVVDGVDDAGVRAAIRHAVETVLDTAAQLRGDWVIAVAPAETPGHWDLAITAPVGIHLTSFAASLADVAALAAHHVARQLPR
jgi:hypothetical protein